MDSETNGKTDQKNFYIKIYIPVSIIYKNIDVPIHDLH